MTQLELHGTTILSVRRGHKVALGGDGQVTLGQIVLKGGARKVRRDRKSTRLNSSHVRTSRMPSSA